jgi:hypothetical protein
VIQILGLLLLLQINGDGPIDFDLARQSRQLRAVRVDAPIEIDGLLTEAAWEQAPLAANFIQTEPIEGAPATEDTEVRVLYDEENLYFGVFAHDSRAAEVVISDLRKDFSTGGGDDFELVLDTFHDERNGYIFSTNAAGAKRDAQMINEGREQNANWDGIWYVETSMASDGWIAEISIPFRTLKFRPSDIQTWGVNFHRVLRSDVRNEDSYWSPMPRIYNIQRVSLAGTLDGLTGIEEGSSFRFKPYVSGTFSEDGLRGVRNGDGDVGFDVKYGVTSGLTLDLTYNTDFSQVEADEQQINLTRFSLFFPEKREFFLENSGIFQFGGAGGGGGGGATSGRTNGVPNDAFFFSRSIGISDSGRSVPILGGARLTGRAGRYEIGLLNMQQRKDGESLATNFTVGRVKMNFMSNSDVGLMIMNKDVMDSSHHNRFWGVDANLRFGQATTVSGYFARTDSPNLDGDDRAAQIALEYEDNVWSLNTAYKTIEDNFTDEMGFLPRRGIQSYQLDLRRTLRPDIEWIRQFQPHVVIKYFADQDGNFDSKYLDFHVPITFQNGSWVEFGKNPTVEVLSEPITIGDVTVPSGTYRYHDWFVVFRPDSSRALQPTGRFGVGPFYTGYKHTYTAGLTWRANYKLNTSVQYTHNNISLAGGRADSDLVTTRVNYSFSTTMFLNALVQYNSNRSQWSSNIRFNIIHRPLSDFYLVYNERRDSITGDLVDRAVIAKLTYMLSR